MEQKSSNYKSGDEIFFGGIKSIDVPEGGTNGDVIVPPTVTISASAEKASATVNVKGSLKELISSILDLTMLNNLLLKFLVVMDSVQVARTILKQIDHSIDFDASATSNRISISDNTIGFSTYHKFRDGETVIYRTFGNTAVGIASHAGLLVSRSVQTED